jgi:ABC-2 type transport system ATP-binding protein
MYGVEPLRLFDHIDRLLDVFDLAKQGDWAIRSYSNGQQKKIAVCGALVSEAPILLLDEPFSGGLDPAGILALKKVLRGLVERRRATIVMTSPVPEILEELADRIVVLREGNIVICDTPDAIKRTARTGGSLAEALARLMHPETVETVERYFEAD